MLHGVHSQFIAHLLGQSIGPIIKGQAVQEDKLPTYNVQHPRRAKGMNALQ